MDDTILRTFPSNEIEALAMLYVKNQDLTDVTPEDLLNMYDNAYETMAAARQAQYESHFKTL